MKKTLIAIMLIALVLILGVLVSCQELQPDELEGTWKNTDTYGGVTTVYSDGYGSYSVSYVLGGVEYYKEQGSYSLDNGYITMNPSVSSMFTQTNPEYVWIYSSGDNYYLALDTDYEEKAYPSSDYDGPFSLTGSTYVMDKTTTEAGITVEENNVFAISDGTLDFSGKLTFSNGPTLLYKAEIKGSATIADTGHSYDLPCKYFYNDTYSKYSETSKYTLSGSTLNMYVNSGDVNYMTLTKQ